MFESEEDSDCDTTDNFNLPESDKDVDSDYDIGDAKEKSDMDSINSTTTNDSEEEADDELNGSTINDYEEESNDEESDEKDVDWGFNPKRAKSGNSHHPRDNDESSEEDDDSESSDSSNLLSRKSKKSCIKNLPSPIPSHQDNYLLYPKMSPSERKLFREVAGKDVDNLLVTYHRMLILQMQQSRNYIPLGSGKNKHQAYLTINKLNKRLYYVQPSTKQCINVCWTKGCRYYESNSTTMLCNVHHEKYIQEMKMESTSSKLNSLTQLTHDISATAYMEFCIEVAMKPLRNKYGVFCFDLLNMFTFVYFPHDGPPTINCMWRNCLNRAAATNQGFAFCQHHLNFENMFKDFQNTIGFFLQILVVKKALNNIILHGMTMPSNLILLCSGSLLDLVDLTNDENNSTIQAIYTFGPLHLRMRVVKKVIMLSVNYGIGNRLRHHRPVCLFPRCFDGFDHMRTKRTYCNFHHDLMNSGIVEEVVAAASNSALYLETQFLEDLEKDNGNLMFNNMVLELARRLIPEHGKGDSMLTPILNVLKSINKPILLNNGIIVQVKVHLLTIYSFSKTILFRKCEVTDCLRPCASTHNNQRRCVEHRGGTLNVHHTLSAVIAMKMKKLVISYAKTALGIEVDDVFGRWNDIIGSISKLKEGLSCTPEIYGKSLQLSLHVNLQTKQIYVIGQCCDVYDRRSKSFKCNRPLCLMPAKNREGNENVGKTTTCQYHFENESTPNECFDVPNMASDTEINRQVRLWTTTVNDKVVCKECNHQETSYTAMFRHICKLHPRTEDTLLTEDNKTIPYCEYIFKYSPLDKTVVICRSCKSKIMKGKIRKHIRVCEDVSPEAKKLAASSLHFVRYKFAIHRTTCFDTCAVDIEYYGFNDKSIMDLNCEGKTNDTNVKGFNAKNDIKEQIKPWIEIEEDSLVCKICRSIKTSYTAMYTHIQKEHPRKNRFSRLSPHFNYIFDTPATDFYVICKYCGSTKLRQDIKKHLRTACTKVPCDVKKLIERPIIHHYLFQMSRIPGYDSFSVKPKQTNYTNEIITGHINNEKDEQESVEEAELKRSMDFWIKIDKDSLKCGGCDFVTNNYHDLRVHIVRKHNQRKDMRQDRPNAAKSNPKWKFPSRQRDFCGYCNLEVNSWSLLRHFPICKRIPAEVKNMWNDEKIETSISYKMSSIRYQDIGFVQKQIQQLRKEECSDTESDNDDGVKHDKVETPRKRKVEETTTKETIPRKKCKK